jgi:malonate transporter and related proteins
MTPSRRGPRSYRSGNRPTGRLRSAIRIDPVQAFLHLLSLTAPLFLLVLLGYALMRWAGWSTAASDWLTKFVFSVAVPALLFRLMSDFSQLPPVDPRLLLAYFGGCASVFVLGRLAASALFRMDGASQSVFAMGGIFSNIVLLGVPLAKVLLSDAAMPAVSLVVVFNSLLLWTLVTVSVEWARQRELSWAAIGKTALGVVTNPVVGAILSGTAFGFTGIVLPDVVMRTIEAVAQAAVPLSLIVLGMGLAEYGIREGWRESAAVAFVKLALQPLVVLLLAKALALPTLETQAVVMLASLPVGANVYLMAREFDTLIGPVAASLVLSTALAAATTPLVLAVLASL